MLKKTFLSLLAFNAAILVACATVERPRTVYSSDIQPESTIEVRQEHPEGLLRVATINVAHGRKDSINQLFIFESTFKENLDDIAEALGNYKPHVVALQEVDAESLWSGSFDHVVYLSSAAGYPWRTHASNAEGWLYSYGTALLSHLPMVETIKHTFEPSPPTLDKGFVLAQIDWPTGDKSKSKKIDVISVHLDFSRQSVREQQIHEMIEILSARMNPTIIMGDFNSEWLAESSIIKELAKKTRYKTYKPESTDLGTYKNKRLDWILITNELEFVNYQVIPDILSDHAMIMADIRLNNNRDE